MNPLLAQIYGTGFDKTASAEELDLNTMTASELLKGLEDGSIVLEGGEETPAPEAEKTAGDVDLSTLTARELLELLEATETTEAEQSQEQTLNKMAESGELNHWDMAGRILAHSYADEMNKLAGNEDLISLDDLNGAQLMELLESGEFELVNTGLEKDAWSVSGKGITSAGKALLHRLRSAATGEKARGAGKAMEVLKNVKPKYYTEKITTGRFTRGRTSVKAGPEAVAKEMEALKSARRRGIAETAGLYGGLGLAGASGATVALRRKNSKKGK